MFKYLKDQGGQFWGAFAQSYANAVEKSRDRPLKEAMLKAQIGQQQALAKKAEMDMQQAAQQQQAMTDLTNVLTTQKTETLPTQVGGPVQGPATETGEAPAAPAPTTTTTRPHTKEEILPYALKAGGKNVVDEYVKTLVGPAGGDKFGVRSLDDAQRLEQDPNFKKSFPHGHRWEVKGGMLVPSGINPVNAGDNIFHTVYQATGGNIAAATAAKQDYLFKAGAAGGSGTFAGRTAQEAEQPINPMVPFAGQQPITAPGYTGGGVSVSPQGNVQTTPGATTSPGRQGGETQAQQVQRMRKEAQTAGSAIPEGLAKAQRDHATLLNTTIADIEGNLDEKFLGARGLPGVQKLRENKITGGFLEDFGVVEKPSEREVIFRTAIDEASDLLLRARSGAQINESEARRLKTLIPSADSDLKTFKAKLARFKHAVQQSIANGKYFANVTRSQLEGVDNLGASPTPVESEAPAGWRRRQ